MRDYFHGLVELLPELIGAGEHFTAYFQGEVSAFIRFNKGKIRQSGRITGMTRFGTFWVENGKLQQPVNVMRFDDTLYQLLGESLEELTRERSLMLDPGTYGRRSSRSSLLPGVPLRAFRLTL